MMLKVYAKDLTKKDTVKLAEEILRTINCEGKSRKSVASSVVLVSEAIRFIVHHFQVNDHLVPLVVAFLKKDRLVIGFCLSSMPDRFYENLDFIDKWGSIPSFLQDFRHSTYLHSPLDEQLDRCLYALTDQAYADSIKEIRPKRGLLKRRIKDNVTSQTVSPRQHGENK